MSKFKFKRFASIGLIFIVIGIFGSGYALSKSDASLGFFGIFSQPYGTYSLILIFIGIYIISWGAGKKLRRWTGLE